MGLGSGVVEGIKWRAGMKESTGKGGGQSEQGGERPSLRHDLPEPGEEEKV